MDRRGFFSPPAEKERARSTGPDVLEEGIMRQLLSASALCLLNLAAAAPQETGEADTRVRLREANRRVLASLEKELAKPEGRPIDVAARAELLGRDPARIIAFVQNELRFEPYPGLQRGPAGVLATGAGNALDKSSLLRELLRASGLEARLVRGTLSKEQASALVKKSVEDLKGPAANRAKGPFGLGEISKERVEAGCREAGVSADEMLRLMRARERAEQALWDEVRALAARETEWLIPQRKDAPAAPLADTLLRETTDHTWVQWRKKADDSWTDADACLAFPGLRAEGEVDPDTAADRIVLSVLLDRKTGERRETVEVVKLEIRAADVLLEPVRLMIQPTEFKLPRPGEAVAGDAFHQQLSQCREFIAVALQGERPPQAMVFDYDGQVSKPKMTAGKLGGTAVTAVARVTDLFSGDKKDGAKSALDRLWVDLTMTRGGKVLWSQTRMILEEGKRESWCPVLTWDVFASSGELRPESVRYARISQRLRNQSALDAIDEWARTQDRDLAKLSQVKAVHAPLDLMTFAAARQAFVAGLGGARKRLHFDHPNVFISGRQARLHAQPRDVCVCYSMDIVENGALVIEAGETLTVNRDATTALGAFDTVFERSRISAANPSEPAAGAVVFFERARMAGHPVRLLAAGDAAALAEAGLTKADAAWIASRASARGQVLVASGMDAAHCGGSCAWWETDAATGRVLGRLSGGRGGCEVLVPAPQEMAEYMEMVSQFNNTMCAMKTLGAILAGNQEAAKNQAIDCIVGQFEGKIFDMAGLGVINTVTDLFDLGDNLGF
jgi:hypothetical protein